jgi:hypothetical protein
MMLYLKRWSVVGLTAMGESMSAFVFEFRDWIAPTSQRSATTNMIGNVNGVVDPQPIQAKSSVVSGSEVQSQDRVFPLGLGIVTKKFARKPFQAKMTRVTEASENRTELVSTNPLSQVESSL